MFVKDTDSAGLGAGPAWQNRPLKVTAGLRSCGAELCLRLRPSIKGGEKDHEKRGMYLLCCILCKMWLLKLQFGSLG